MGQYQENVFDQLLIELDGIAVSKGFTFLAAKNGVDFFFFSEFIDQKKEKTITKLRLAQPIFPS
jgi:cytochrome c-type biogenesis protein CcmE